MNKILSHLSIATALSTVALTAGDYTAPKQIAGDPHCSEVPWDSHRVDSHAPIGVMGDHLHEKGETMLSYRYMYMDMRDNYLGDNRVSNERTLIGPQPTNEFQIIPTDMRTEMHMIGMMHAPTDDLTLMFMIPMIDKRMNHLVANGTSFETQVSGIGDFQFGGLLGIYEEGNSRIHLNLAATAPTGSIDNDAFVPPANATIRTPYPMQLGSGTWDLKPGITYLGQCDDLSWGAQILGTIRLGENDENYTFGDDITANLWTAYRLCDSVSASIRVTGTAWDDIEGQDALIRGPVPTARPDLRAGQRIDVFGGVNYQFQQGALRGHRLAVEVGAPVYQDLDDRQLGMDWMGTVGWQKAF